MNFVKTKFVRTILSNVQMVNHFRQLPKYKVQIFLKNQSLLKFCWHIVQFKKNLNKFLRFRWREIFVILSSTDTLRADNVTWHCPKLKMMFARATFLSQSGQYGHYLGSCMRVGSQYSWVFCANENFCRFDLKLDQALPKVSSNDVRMVDNERSCQLIARGNSSMNEWSMRWNWSWVEETRWQWLCGRELCRGWKLWGQSWLRCMHRQT